MNTPAAPSTPFDAEPPDDVVLAGEYVLGVQDDATRAALRARIDRDPAFAADVAAWEAGFGAWLARIAPAHPGPHVWPGIRRRLGWAPVASVDAPARVWDSPVFWRATAGLAMAAAVGAIAIALHRPVAVSRQPQVVQVPARTETGARPVTVLASDDGRAAWVASFDAAHGAVRMTPVPTPDDPQGRVHELWLIPKGEAPRSLGFVSNHDAHSVDIPAADRAAVQAGAVLAVTLEPAAGMPHKGPTGPVVAKGVITRA